MGMEFKGLDLAELLIQLSILFLGLSLAIVGIQYGLCDPGKGERVWRVSAMQGLLKRPAQSVWLTCQSLCLGSHRLLRLRIEKPDHGLPCSHLRQGAILCHLQLPLQRPSPLSAFSSARPSE
jgi:hypothetical protein